MFFFFFPALPGEHETLSVNYWNFDENKLITRNSLQENNQPWQIEPNKTSTKHWHHRQGNSQNNVKQGETLRAPLSPSLVLFHHIAILHAVHCLDVSHIYICTYILRRVSNVRLQSTSLELISALTSLPPFCTNEAAQGRRTIERLKATPKPKKGHDPCFRSPDDSRMINP